MKMRSTRRSKRVVAKRQMGGEDATLGYIKVPSGTMNFNFAKAVSTLPPTFGTLVPGGADSSTFTINLAPTYSPANLPAVIVTGYVYSTTAGYINVQRQFGLQSGTAGAIMAIDPAVKRMTFSQITKPNFPYTANDASPPPTASVAPGTPAATGYALYIIFKILN